MLPFEVEARATRAASTPVDSASIARKVRAELPRWVARLVSEARAGMASTTLAHAVASDRQHQFAALQWLQGRPTELTRILEKALLRALDETAAGGGYQRSQDSVATPAGASVLQLMDEAVIDESIELARIVQVVEAEAEAEMRELAATCSGLYGLAAVDPRCLPLPAAACARGLRDGVMALDLEPAPRTLLLRHLGAALGRELRRTWAALSAWLVAQGVQPARYRLSESPSSPGTSLAAGSNANAPRAEAGAPSTAAAAEALQRMVERAQRMRVRMEASHPAIAASPGVHGAADASPSAHGALSLSFNALHTTTLQVQPLGPGLETKAALRLMEQLLDQVEQQIGAKPSAQAMLDALRNPGRRLAAADARVWDQTDHPWWDLLNQVLDAGVGHAELGLDAAQALASAFARALQGIPSRAACQAAADEVRGAAARSHASTAEALAAQAASLLVQLDWEETASKLRSQLVHQLHATPVAPMLRQFLLGPWMQTMTHTARHHGLDSEQLARNARTVDDLTRASARVGVAAPPRQRAMLLKEVRAALTIAGMDGRLAERWLADLEATLADPPPPAEDALQAPQNQLPTPCVIDLHAGLPTVPLAMGEDSTLADGNHGRWLDTLSPGTYCRLFLLGRWTTVQLSWVSPRGNLFLFTSRHAGGPHSLTGRMLEKLRAAGLATSIEDKFLLAQAMDSVMMVEGAMLAD